MEEKAALLRRMAPVAPRGLGDHYLQEAKHYDSHVETVRKMLINDQEFQDHEQIDRQKAG
jgi:hypothetical protein